MLLLGARADLGERAASEGSSARLPGLLLIAATEHPKNTDQFARYLSVGLHLSDLIRSPRNERTSPLGRKSVPVPI